MDESPGFGELRELYSSLSDGTPEFRKLRELYSSLVKGDESNVIAQYSDWGQRRFEDFTCCRDTILHLAIYMKRENIAKKVLERHVQSGLLLPPLTQKNALGDTVLHDAAATNMTSLAKELLIVTPELLSIQNNNSETPLFRAVRFGHTEMFRLLADWVKIIKVPNLPHLTDMNGSTILHMAIIAEFFDLALEIAMKYPDLINIKNEKGMIGLQLLSKNPSAFKSGRKYALLKRFIYYCIPNENTDVRDGSHQGNNSQLEPEQSPMHTVCLYLTSVAKKINISVWKFLCRVWPMMARLYGEKKKHESAFKLAKLLIVKDRSWWTRSQENSIHQTHNIPKDPGKAENAERLTSLLMATSTGIVEIVEEILRVYPQAVDHVTPDKCWNILHVAISHRQLEIFHLVKKMDIPMARLVRRIDEDQCTILHHVGFMKYYKGGTLPGPVLQLQEELQWFERVRKIIPSHYEMHRCQIKQKTAQTHQFDLEAQAAEIDHVAQPTEASQNIPPIHGISELSPLIPQTAQDKQLQEIHARIFKEVQEYLKLTSQTAQTAQELFEQTHAALLKEAQEWLKRTSEACSAVAVLIATVAFAAAYTVPGGSNQDTGVPILLQDPFFLVFTVMDVLSLASSLTSVVMFLSILTSPFELRDFRISLPQRLTLGFTFLFFSVAVTMLAFAATIILIIHLKKRWTTTLIYTAAFLPVSVFALLQFPLYVAFMSTLRFSWKVIRRVLPSCCFLQSRFKNTTTGSIYKTL